MHGGFYNKSQWWIRHKEDGNAAIAKGAYGQMLYIDPANELVVARFGSGQQAPGHLNYPVIMAQIDLITAQLT